MAQVRNVSGWASLSYTVSCQLTICSGPPRLIRLQKDDMSSLELIDVSPRISRRDLSFTASSPSRSPSNSSSSTIRAGNRPLPFPPSPAISSSSTCVASATTTALQESFDRYTLGLPELTRRLVAMHYHLTLRLLENHHVCQICNATPANVN